MGDRNTTFYHKTVSQRVARNHIHFLRDEDDHMISSTVDIKAHSASYFEDIIGKTDLPVSPASLECLQNQLPFRCTDMQCTALQTEVLETEIKTTIFAMPLDKSPGPDGYSVEFIRASWDVVGKDIVAAVSKFFRNDRLLRDHNTTAIILIPKKQDACKLGDFRSISCCNIVYKIISKIIANRLKPVLLQCVSSNQAAFLKGRSLGENVLLASDLI